MSKLTPIVLILLAIMIAVLTFMGDRGWLALREIKQEHALLQGENRRLSAEISSLESKIYGLEHDPFFLEKQAREEIGLSREGELLYLFPKLDAKQ